MFQLVFSLYHSPEELGFSAGKECLSRGQINLAGESEGKQARSESFLLPCPFMGCHQKVWPRFRVVLPTSDDPDLGWVSPPQIIQTRKPAHSAGLHGTCYVGRSGLEFLILLSQPPKCWVIGVHPHTWFIPISLCFWFQELQ